MLTLSRIIERLGDEARNLGVTLPERTAHLGDMEPRELVAARQAFRNLSRSVLDKMSDGASDAEIRQCESIHTLAMAGFDLVRDEEELRAVAQSDERQRRRPRESGEQFGGDSPDGEFRAAPGGWSDRNGTEIRVLSPSQPFATETRANGPALGDMLRAMVTGPRNEMERRALAEGTDSAGGYTVPTPLASEFIDRLRAKSVAIRAGARTVPMTSETLAIARLETDPVVAWRQENAAVAESDPTFGRVTLQARSLMGMVRVSRELLDDSVNVSEMLTNAFTLGMALEFDRAILFGSGTAPEPRGVFNTNGINVVSLGANGDTLDGYGPLIDAIYQMQLDNSADPTAMIWHPRTGANLAKLVDGDGNPLVAPEMVAKVPKLSTTSVPIDQAQGTGEDASTVLMGDWTQLLIGLRSSLRIEVLKERYADYHQYAFVAHMRGDAQLAHTGSFSAVTGILAPA